jgi:hypothetical protein
MNNSPLIGDSNVEYFQGMSVWSRRKINFSAVSSNNGNEILLLGWSTYDVCKYDSAFYDKIFAVFIGGNMLKHKFLSCLF